MATVHFTPSQVRLILNGYIIDEAHGIDYDIMDERTPLFGFRDRTFADISVGRTLVYGNLYINFVYKGYLLQAIAHTKNIRHALPFGANFETPVSYSQLIMDALGENDELRSAGIPDSVVKDPVKIRALLANTFEKQDVKNFNEVAKATQDEFWRTNKRNNSQSIETVTKNKVTEQAFRKAVASGRSGDYPKNMLVARPGSLTTPFDLTIAYGMEADNPMYNEVIQDVYIKGQSKVIRASVAGAEDILLERYQFVARTIV